MKNKIIIGGIVLLLSVAVAFFFLSGTDHSGHNHSENAHEESQLYTCGMHPDIISDEPGNCPICDMKLTPVKKDKKKNKGERKIIYWRAPMNPNEVYDAPGKSKMGMDLVPVYDDEGGAEGTVTVDGTLRQTMNLKTTIISSKEISSEIKTNGILTVDERKEYMITTKVKGWIEKLFVNFVGQRVRKGEKLMEIYSPELVAAEQELLSAIEYNSAIKSGTTDKGILNSGSELVKNAIRKLELLDIPKTEIKKLIQTRNIKKTIALFAPADGTVIMKKVLEGEKINPGQPLLHIADLSNMWLKADIYENEIYKIQLNANAKIKLRAFPGEEFFGKVSFIYPTIDKKTRVLKIRLDVANESNIMKPGMYGTVELTGKNFGVHPVVDENSIIRDGSKNIAILDLGEGRLKPVQVKIGKYFNGYYQILQGLKEGDRVVASAQFLIDSESNLKAALQQFKSSDEAKSENIDSENILSSKENSEMKMESGKPEVQNHENEIVRKGKINLSKIDLNKDGKVFQDFMDWNVISDKPGRCPLCGMKLREVTLEEARKNLIENGFEVEN